MVHPTDPLVNSVNTGLYPLLPSPTTQKCIIPKTKAGKLQDKKTCYFCSCLPAFAATFYLLRLSSQELCSFGRDLPLISQGEKDGGRQPHAAAGKAALSSAAPSAVFARRGAGAWQNTFVLLPSLAPPAPSPGKIRVLGAQSCPLPVERRLRGDVGQLVGCLQLMSMPRAQ